MIGSILYSHIAIKPHSQFCNFVLFALWALIDRAISYAHTKAIVIMEYLLELSGYSANGAKAIGTR